MSPNTRDSAGLILAALLGATAFFIYCGWWVLIPTNIAWLDSGDRAMHQLGWMFFREAPWGFPPGASPDLGIELASSIALVDGPAALCHPVQAHRQLAAATLPILGLLAAVELHAPIILCVSHRPRNGSGEGDGARRRGLRPPHTGLPLPRPMHLALSGHWVLLAGLYFYARRTPPARWMWPLVAGLTSAIHATLLAMLLGLWLASWGQRIWLLRLSARTAILELALVGATTAAILWLVGFFGTGSYGSYGYGDYKLNLLWPFLRYGWSQIVPDWPHTRFDYEGLSFLGIGIFALLAIAILSSAILQLRAVATRKWLPLTLLLLGLMAFAFSKTLSLGPTDILHIPMPGFIEMLGAAFRSTGRFVWPLLYVITIGSVVLIAKRFRLAVALPLVLAAFTAQAVDSFPAWSSFGARMPEPAATWQTPLKSEFWDRAAEAGYDRVRTIPLRTSYGADWKVLGYYAVTHDMDTDTVLLGRVDEAALADLRTHESEVLKTGAFEPKTIYVLDVLSSLAAAEHATSTDLLAIVDHRIVFLRDGAKLADGLDLRPVGLAH